MILMPAITRAHDLLRESFPAGDRFVTIFGAPVGVSGTTNAMSGGRGA